MDLSALFNIEYGLYLLSTKYENKDNACIINTVMQVTSNPIKIAIAVNKSNYTCELVQKSKKFNLSILTNETELDTFKHFGFQSGRNVDKFINMENLKRSKNDVLYLTENVNSILCATVENEIDLESHILFIALINETIKISNKPTVTYNYYQENIKPKPKKEDKKGYRCKICNYIYEGDILPEDFICPLCKHGVSDFEKI